MSTSARKQDANKRNALRSSGPRSPEGKTRSCNNSRKHGLATKIGSTEGERRRIDHIASRLAAGRNDIWITDRARYVAEVHLERVKAATAQALQRLTTAKIHAASNSEPGSDELGGSADGHNLMERFWQNEPNQSSERWCRAAGCKHAMMSWIRMPNISILAERTQTV
jgi:hypothetical protein